MGRVKRKWIDLRAWVGSSNRADFLSAALLAICRTRPLNGQSLHSRCFRKLIRRLSVHPRNLGGLSVSIDPSSLDELVIYQECFVTRIYDLSFLSFTPDVVIDCGGFIGYFTLLAKARFPSAKFIAFEPHPTNYGLMCLNFERNGLEIDSRCEAVSNRAGKRFFSGGGLGGSLVTKAVEPAAIQVDVTNLCGLIRSLSSHRVLLKLDVEGEEKDLLPEIVPLLPQTCGVFFESHHGEENFEELEQLFKTAGFLVTRAATRDKRFIDAFAIREAVNEVDTCIA